jgi:shikimate dehydrogenase
MINCGGEERKAGKEKKMLIHYHGDAKQLCVIGDPVRHSLSPAIYNTLFAHYGINAIYTTVRVPKGGLQDFLAFARMNELWGFNATMPHKADLLPLVDGMDEHARLHGSINTVVCREGRMLGYSTDALGFRHSLAQEGISLQGQRMLLLGAGGAAATIGLEAALEGAQLTIAARRKQAAAELAAHILRSAGKNCGCCGFEELEQRAGESTLVVNATPLGMIGKEEFADLSFVQALPENAAVCDIVYMPRKTRLLQAAESRGLHAVGGIGMLIWQGCIAFEKYFDILPNREDVRAIMETMGREGYEI